MNDFYDPGLSFRFGGGASATTIHPATMVVLLIAIGLILFLPRKHVLVVLLSISILTPFGQQLYVAGTHLYVGRILILFGWIRFYMMKSSSKRTEIASGGFAVIDKLFVLWAIFHATAS